MIIWSTEVRNNENRCPWNIIKKRFLFAVFIFSLLKGYNGCTQFFSLFLPCPSPHFFLLVFERPLNKKYLHSILRLFIMCIVSTLACAIVPKFPIFFFLRAKAHNHWRMTTESCFHGNRFLPLVFEFIFYSPEENKNKNAYMFYCIYCEIINII